MDWQQERQYVKEKINRFISSVPSSFRVGESKRIHQLAFEDSGVPADMENSEPDHEGYVEWKLLPSTLVLGDLEVLEEKYGFQWPSLYKAFLTTYFHLINEVRGPDYSVLLPEQPSDKPLYEIEYMLRSWEQLLAFGYIPFSLYNDGWGPICFDTVSCGVEADYPIVWFDHEEIFALEHDALSRAALEPLAKKLQPNFRAFIDRVFSR
ncbi:SMI1/KNR4 family protein [Paenibacillus sp. CAU 1782]